MGLSVGGRMGPISARSTRMGLGQPDQVGNSWAGLSLSQEVLVATPDRCSLSPISLGPGDLQLLF